jgi:hypothetical protein
LTGIFTTTDLSIAQGVIYDEDIRFDTGGTKTATTLWNRNATDGMRMTRGSVVAKGLVGGVLAYDNGSGTLQPVTNNSYTTNWVFCSNDVEEPIYTVIGQNNDTTIAQARNASFPTINLSTAEWKLIYRVIYRRTTGTPTGEYIEASDFRSVQTGVPTSAVSQDHSALTGRDLANSHPASAIGFTKADTTLSDVQTELERLEDTSGTNTGDQESSDFDHNALTNTHNLTTDIDHDALTNFVANEHIDWTNATSNLLTTGTGTFLNIVETTQHFLNSIKARCKH